MTRPETLDRKFASKLPPPALEFIKLLLSLDSTKRPSCIEVGGQTDSTNPPSCVEVRGGDKEQGWHADCAIGELRLHDLVCPA